MRRYGLGLLAAVALAGTAACNDDEGTSDLPAELAYVSGDDQTGEIGATLVEPLVVEVLTASGDPVEGVELRWEVEGGGSVNDESTETGANGRSSVTFTLGQLVGTQSVVVSVPGLDLGEVVFTAEATDPSGGGEL